MQFTQKEALYTDFKRVKVALLGEGRIHGEDDAIALRPYQASLICSVSGSEAYELTRAEFYRAFKTQSDCWKTALKSAKEKEVEYIKRCRSYLDTNKEIIERSNAEARRQVLGFKAIKEAEEDKRV